MEFSSKRQTSPGSKRESGLNNTHSESISPSMFSDFITDRPSVRYRQDQSVTLLLQEGFVP